MMNQEFEHLRMQHTIGSPISLVGIGLHGGRQVTMRVLPAEAGNGISFTRRDLPEGENQFAASWAQVGGTDMCTTLINLFGHYIATVEHLLASLSGLGIDNAQIVIDGAELPVADGSALPFVTALTKAGIKPLGVARDVLVVRRPVRVQHGESWAELLPDVAPRISISIDFQRQDIGLQSLSLCVSPQTFREEVAAARTFGFAEQLWHLRCRGLALGGSLNNAVLVENGRVANLEGLRFPDEFVRHKALDVIGDLALAGLPIIGHYRAHRPGHRLNNDLLRLLMNDTRSWQRVAAAELLDGRLNRRDQSVIGVDIERPGLEDPAPAYEGDRLWRDVMAFVLKRRPEDSG
ncbi:MAG: UDP-3-O-acyl-N-acetylglucosamine deacetylase [Chromatiaceae bacterium]|nr:UDP-3-O-acyl-N-acetylglucosamine deacetylase [Chromatiaceae bacterium]